MMDQVESARLPPVPRRVTLRLGAFGAESLRAQAERHGISMDELFAGAAQYYLALFDQARERASLQVPRLVRPPASGKSGSAGDLELRLDLVDSEWAALAGEAKRQQVPVEGLLEHALLLFLADMDAGRMAFRVLKRLK